MSLWEFTSYSVLCYGMLSNGCMQPSMLTRHSKTKHSEHDNFCQHKPWQFFEQRRKTCNILTGYLEKFVTLNDKCLKASLEISYLKAKDTKPRTIGQTLLPEAIKMAAIIHGEEYVQKLKSIPLSTNSVVRQFDIIVDTLKKQLLIQVTHYEKFVLRPDKSTNVIKFAQLIVFIKYIFNNESREELLFCEQLKKRCTGEDTLSIVNDFFCHK